MTITRLTLVVSLLAACVASRAAADAVFASPPHFIRDEARHQVVFFLNEPVSGALTARDPSGAFVVRVPRSTVEPAIQGQDFGAEGWGDGGDAVRHLVLATGSKGDTHIRIEPAIPGGVDAHTADDPPRLVIELVATTPTRSPAPVASRSPAKSAAPKATTAKATAPRATATPRPRPTASSTLAPSPRASGKPVPSPTVTGGVEPVAIASVPRIPGSLSAAVGLGCLWQRVAGLAFCAADPKAAAYAGDRTVTSMVAALARGRLPEPEEPPALTTPAMAFLTADHAFVARAPDARLLPVIYAYRRALRAHPDFPEAWRARLNIALAYRAMEFRAELQTAAAAAAFDPTAGLVRALAGDLAVAAGQLPAAEDEYRVAAQTGGAGPCFAARGRARLALAAGDAGRAAPELAALGVLCPAAVMADPETVWLRARLALANRDIAAARTLLTEIQGALGRADQGAVIADLGAVAEAAGDAAAARKSYEQLMGGAYGARAARRATVRLAILDGVGGDVAAGLKRLERLTPEASDPARRALVMQATRTALARGEAAAAIATLHEARVDPAHLGLDEQLVVAEAYRGVGLANEAERVLATARASAGSSPPDALFAERGATALARRDGVAALAIADEWLRGRGRNAGALALRARATALAGDGIGTHAAVAAAVLEDPSLARTLALDAAEALRDREPTAALVLVGEALAPGSQPELPAARAAAGLAMIGELAEAAGDDDTALAAFTTLGARYASEPVAAGAAYRAARLAARHAPGSAATAYDEAARSKDVLARRMAGAARDYEAIVRPLGGAKAVP